MSIRKVHFSLSVSRLYSLCTSISMYGANTHMNMNKSRKGYQVE